MMAGSNDEDMDSAGQQPQAAAETFVAAAAATAALHAVAAGWRGPLEPLGRALQRALVEFWTCRTMSALTADGTARDRWLPAWLAKRAEIGPVLASLRASPLLDDDAFARQLGQFEAALSRMDEPPPTAGKCSPLPMASKCSPPTMAGKCSPPLDQRTDIESATDCTASPAWSADEDSELSDACPPTGNWTRLTYCGACEQPLRKDDQAAATCSYCPRRFHRRCCGPAGGDDHQLPSPWFCDACLAPSLAFRGGQQRKRKRSASSDTGRRPPASTTGRLARGSRVTMPSLVAAGLLREGDKITVPYQGKHEFCGVVDAEGMIALEGRRFASPGAFALFCKRKVYPEKKSDRGWTSCFHGETPLAEYRDAVEAMAKAAIANAEEVVEAGS